MIPIVTVRIYADVSALALADLPGGVSGSRRQANALIERVLGMNRND